MSERTHFVYTAWTADAPDRVSVAEWCGYVPGDIRRSVAGVLALLGFVCMGVFHG